MIQEEVELSEVLAIAMERMPVFEIYLRGR